ncbi:hypothetical protein ISCGN_002951 [Ixodes scapularis]
MRTESERRGGAGDEATYSPTAARAPEFELEVTVDPVDLWRWGGSVVGCSRSGNRLDENLATALELTEGKTKPDIFYQTAERMDDVKESEKQAQDSISSKGAAKAVSDAVNLQRRSATGQPCRRLKRAAPKGAPTPDKLAAVGMIHWGPCGPGSRYEECSDPSTSKTSSKESSLTVLEDRVNEEATECSKQTKEYRIILPRLPTGPFQMSHVWMAVFANGAAKYKVKAQEELEIKKKKCLVIDPTKDEIKMKLLWLPPQLPDSEVKKVLEPFGTVNVITRERWRFSDLQETDTLTRFVTLVLKDHLSVDKVPHMLTIYGVNTLVVIPGRPPLCLRCKAIGHIRRQCSTPRCKQCWRYGHSTEECVVTYASKLQGNASPSADVSEHLMDVDELFTKDLEPLDDSQESEKTTTTHARSPRGSKRRHLNLAPSMP